MPTPVAASAEPPPTTVAVAAPARTSAAAAPPATPTIGAELGRKFLASVDTSAAQIENALWKAATSAGGGWTVGA
ncbi:MAG: hypothetical protein IV086_02665 [Hyphomonadaceae bacterium]|nr:hypothetical protein [Hyphomonadaceae bacterium]